MGDPILNIIIINILPIVVSVGSVGYKIYYDLGQVKQEIATNKTEIKIWLQNITNDVSTIDHKVSDLQSELKESKAFDAGRDLRLERLEKEIYLIRQKVYNGK